MAPMEFAHQGLAAAAWQDRAPFILAIKKVMSTWTGFDEVNERCSEVDLHVKKHVQSYSQREIEATESALATLYTQSFYRFFGRAAIVPRRLLPRSQH